MRPSNGSGSELDESVEGGATTSTQDDGVEGRRWPMIKVAPEAEERERPDVMVRVAQAMEIAAGEAWATAAEAADAEAEAETEAEAGVTALLRVQLKPAIPADGTPAGKEPSEPT